MDTSQGPSGRRDWKILWDDWDARVIVLSSLFLQTFLLFTGPLRKRTARGIINLLLWTAYILSPMISTYGFGLIKASMITESGTYTQLYLLLLWSIFLLLHLSRPDTITAFSLEDNQLWLRKSINLAFYGFGLGQQLGIATSVSQKSDFWAPIVIMYVIGINKYGRWIESLRSASSVGTDVCLPERVWLTTTDDFPSPLSDLQVLKHAYRLFKHFKGLIVDFSFTFSKCCESRAFLLRLTPKDAFRVVERELNFFYQVIYTKAWIFRTWFEFCCILAEFVALLVAFVLFYIEDKEGLKTGDIVISYLLFGGSIFLEASAMMMVLNSDWFIAYLRSRDGYLKQIETWLTFFTAFLPKFVHRKWCNSISQYNLLNYCLRPKKERLEDSISTITIIWKTIESIRYVDTEKFNDGIRDFIVMHLKTKSEISDNPSTAREIQSARGGWVICNENCRHLLPSINGLDFDEILLTWHVATDLCFHNNNGDNSYRNLSKWLSDYMFYLLIWQPEMMSTVDARGDKRFKDTCAEVRKFLLQRNIRKTKENELEVLNQACVTVISSYTEDNESMSVLTKARELAAKLMDLGESRRWEVLSNVWVEMLCYAASHCKASAHMKQIQQGGQLLTFVWLLMVHFGLVN